MKLMIDIPEEEYNECKNRFNMALYQEGYINYNLNTALVMYIALGKPLEDVTPIVRRKCSITHGMYENRIWCNNCGFIKVITGEEENYNFCPKCGAIAESEEKE